MLAEMGPGSPKYTVPITGGAKKILEEVQYGPISGDSFVGCLLLAAATNLN
jgi:hypothetical protein